jgi:hypothetical protein
MIGTLYLRPAMRKKKRRNPWISHLTTSMIRLIAPSRKTTLYRKVGSNYLE